jgi:hypothetical protein
VRPICLLSASSDYVCDSPLRYDDSCNDHDTCPWIDSGTASRQPSTASAMVKALSSHLVPLQISTHGAKGALHLLALLSKEVDSLRVRGSHHLLTSNFRRHFCDKQKQPTDLKPGYGLEPKLYVCDCDISHRHWCDKPPKHLLQTSMVSTHMPNSIHATNSTPMSYHPKFCSAIP